MVPSLFLLFLSLFWGSFFFFFCLFSSPFFVGKNYIRAVYSMPGGRFDMWKHVNERERGLRGREWSVECH